MAFSEDLTEFLDVSGGFAVTATFGVIGAVTGIFDRAYLESSGIAGYRPVFLCRASDVASAAIGETVTIDSTAYTLAERQPDGTGMTTLVLEGA